MVLAGDVAEPVDSDADTGPRRPRVCSTKGSIRARDPPCMAEHGLARRDAYALVVVAARPRDRRR